MNRWIISDTHFFHRNIIPYENRPFNNVLEMNEKIIKNWNSKVSKNDIIFHLGDVYLGASREEILEVLSRLNGRINLISGNHDRDNINFFRKTGLFESVSKYPIIIDKFIILSHEPVYLEQESPYINFYGHVHKDQRYQNITTNSACLCVERWDYTPVKIEKLKTQIIRLRKENNLKNLLT